MPEEKNTIKINKEDLNKDKSEDKKAEDKKEISPEEKIIELEDKLTRSFAELENQRRRFEKEKDEAFDYGGMVFARDALNLLDNLERSKQSINNDQNLDENSKKKIMDHIEIILNDTLTIFKKNNIVPVVSIVPIVVWFSYSAIVVVAAFRQSAALQLRSQIHKHG